VTIVAELGELSRFARAKQLMGYGGIVASEHSSGECTRRGGITKTRRCSATSCSMNSTGSWSAVDIAMFATRMTVCHEREWP